MCAGIAHPGTSDVRRCRGSRDGQPSWNPWVPIQARVGPFDGSPVEPMGSGQVGGRRKPDARQQGPGTGRRLSRGRRKPGLSQRGVAFLLGWGCPGDVLLAPHRQRRGPAGLGAVHPTEVARGRGLPRAVSEAGGTAAAGAAPSAYMAPGSRCLTHEELPTARRVGRRTGGPCRAPAWGERGAAALERRGWAGVSPIGNPRVPATDRLGPPGPSC